jgi:GTP cyclohydrolase III
MHGFGLPIFVYDAEFQFDRNKLTIYYECNVRIDFRDFVRQLYSTYKARIWMKIGNMNTPVDAQPLAVMALATGVHFSGGNAGGMP